MKKLAKADVLLVCGDVDRGYVYEGKKYAQLLDSVNELLEKEGITAVTIADPYALVYGKQAFGKVCSINGLMARATHAYAVLRRVRPGLPVHQIPMVKAWGKVIQKVSPSLVIGIQPSAEMCIAAKQNNKWIADLQHGILSDEGYYGLNARKRFGDRGWPDSVLCWDTASAGWLEEKLGNKVAKEVIGNPWFIRFMYPSGSDKLVMQAMETIREPDNAGPVILVTLQWGVKGTAENHEIGIPHALLTIMKKNTAARWWIRIHPVQLRGEDGTVFLQKLETEFSGCSHVSWKTASESPLPLLLRRTDMHISIQSAVTIEASWFGIKTALLHPDTALMREYFKEQLDNGLAQTIPADEQAISEWINTQQRGKEQKKNTTHFNREWLERFITHVKMQVRQ